MAGRLLTILDMRPSTTSNTTSNQDPKLTAPSAKLFLGKTISSKSYNYAKERASFHRAVQVCRVLA